MSSKKPASKVKVKFRDAQGIQRTGMVTGSTSQGLTVRDSQGNDHLARIGQYTVIVSS